MEVPDILKNKWVQTGGISILAFAAGGGAGYFLGQYRVKKSVRLTLDEFAKEDTHELRIFDCGVVPVEDPVVGAHADSDVETPVDPVIEEVLEEDVPTDSPESFGVDEEVVSNIWEDRVKDPYWDWEREKSNRVSSEPYVIHQEEFIADEMDYRQETLTYYQGDDIMADPQDVPVYDYTGLMGELKFGHGSGSPEIVYIRNEAIHMEWEILLHTGKFEEEILGLAYEKESEEELRHSVYKFRGSDQ